LLAVGTLFLSLGLLAMGGQLHLEEKGSARQLARPGEGSVCSRASLSLCQALALTVLGSLAFLPGFFYTRVAYYAWRGVPGYSYEDIPLVE